VITPLDYSKLKEYLLNCNDSTMLYKIIYEIRYRLTHSHKGPQRNYVLYSYIKNDVLGIDSKQNSIIDKFLNLGYAQAAEECSAFINLLAGMNVSAQYLIKSLVNILLKEVNCL